jgi:hypothetical protein
MPIKFAIWLKDEKAEAITELCNDATHINTQ